MSAVRMPSERSALAALAAHFAPEQVAADLAAHSAAEVWRQRVRADTSGRLARYEDPSRQRRPCATFGPSRHRRFVVWLRYSGSFPSARFRLGLYDLGAGEVERAGWPFAGC